MEKEQQPNEQEFARLVREHKSTIYTVCYMFSKDNDEVNDLFQEILTATAQKLIRMKTLRRRFEMGAIPLCVVLVAWMCWEGLQSDMGVMAHGFVIGGLVGGTIGGIIGFSIYRKFQKTNDELIRQIAELTAA